MIAQHFARFFDAASPRLRLFGPFDPFDVFFPVRARRRVERSLLEFGQRFRNVGRQIDRSFLRIEFDEEFDPIAASDPGGVAPDGCDPDCRAVSMSAIVVRQAMPLTSTRTGTRMRSPNERIAALGTRT